MQNKSLSFIWAKVLSYMEGCLNELIVSEWFDDAELLSYEKGVMTVYSPNEFHREMIATRCDLYIKDAMREKFEEEVTVRVVDTKAQPVLANPFAYNTQFTFDRFIVGKSNEFAHAAAIAVANKPAEAYNPLFIYGPSGLGKTHLLYAIAGEISFRNPDFNIVYIKGDQFTNEMIQALQEGRNTEFRNKYRNADLFLVDDIQFIAGKEATQEEFFHTFNNLYENRKQIVLTSDRPPSDMLRLEDRLKTRFEWGVIADIRPPDYETRMAIIRNKSRSLGMEMPDDVCSYIAENITNNIRQIEGTVKKIKAYWELTGMEINKSNVARAIKDMYKGKGDALPTPSLIIAEVSRYYNIDENTLTGKLKNKGTAEARQMAMYLIRKMTNLSFPDIGKAFNRDHTTVIHGVTKVEDAVNDPANPLNETIKEIMANINNKL